MINKILIYALIIFIGVSCSSTTNPIDKKKVNSSFTPKYAKFFKIEYFDHYKEISLINPWDNQLLNFKYILVKDSIQLKEQEVKNSFYIKNTPKNAVALSSPVVGMLNTINLSSKIIGLTDPQLIYDSSIIARVEKDEIENVGKSIQLNMEKLIMLNPDIVIGSGWDQLSPDYKKMIKLNMIPVLMYDWQEMHPLGRAEWIIFLASFFNEEENAKAIFNDIENRYQEMKAFGANKEKPLVFNGSEYQGIWYSAGGQSYMSKLYKDAGAQYLFAQDSAKGSVKLDFEVIMLKAAHTPIWMYTGGVDSARLAIFGTPKYMNFDAIKTHQVYSYHKRIAENGANDYWETGGIRPDLVLQDMIQIFHPEEGKTRELYYFDQVDY